MTEVVASASSTPTVLRAARWAAVGIVALTLVIAGYAVGQSGSGTEWREGPAHVGDRQAGIRVDGWEYGIGRSVAWVDESGNHHADGWPSCLDVPAGTTVEGLRFATVNVETEGVGWREVVLVDCR